MILCRWGAIWCLAQRAKPASSDCSLSVRNAIGEELARFGFEPYVYRTFWHRHFPSTEGIVFYPTVTWRGLLVYPNAWHYTATEPLVHCVMMPWDGSISPASTVEEKQRRVEELKAEGWEWDWREGGRRYIHVDELEKVEGPPPTGTF